MSTNIVAAAEGTVLACMAGIVVIVIVALVLSTWCNKLPSAERMQDQKTREMLSSHNLSLYDVIVFRVNQQMTHASSVVVHQNALTVSKMIHWNPTCLKEDRHRQAFLREYAQLHASNVPMYIEFFAQAPKTYVLCDISLVKWCLSDVDTFDRASTLTSLAHVFQLDNVFTTTDSTLHDRLRKFFIQEIKTPNIQEMDHVLDKHIHNMFEKYTHCGSDSSSSSSRVKFLVVPEMEAMVLCAFSELFFGITDFPNASECCMLIKRIWQIKSLRGNIQSCWWNPMLYAELHRLRRRLFFLTSKVIEQNPRVLKHGTDTVFGKLCSLYSDPTSSTSQNLWNVLIPLYETLSRTVICALIQLAHHPRVQHALFDEIHFETDETEWKAAIGSDDEHETLSPWTSPSISYYEDTESTLLQRVCQETLRMLPPTANQTRLVIRANPLFEVGSKVSVSWKYFHMNPTIWGSDAAEFNPDRWIHFTYKDMNSSNNNNNNNSNNNDDDDDAQQKRLQRQAYNPFSLGSQSCVGKHYATLGCRLMLSKLVQRCEFAPHNSQFPIQEDGGFSRGISVNDSLYIAFRK